MFTEHPLLPFYPPEGALEAGLDRNGSTLPSTEGPPSPRNQPNTALLSLILMLGTFLIAFFLRKFRNSRFLGGKVCGRREWGLWSPRGSPSVPARLRSRRGLSRRGRPLLPVKINPWTQTKPVHPHPLTPLSEASEKCSRERSALLGGAGTCGV